MNIPGFTTEALAEVQQMLYAEGQDNPYEGKCGQRKLREQNKTQRTPNQQDADRQRALEARGHDRMSSATRSEAAKKAAETRARCKGTTPGKTSTNTPTTT